MIRKRSVTIRGHRTSLSMEDEFWAELERLARQGGGSLGALVTRVDAARGPEQNLSSALRLHVLRALKGAIAAGATDRSDDPL